MLKVLVNAYACSPAFGSEPGMGWRWCSALARHCELHIITEGEFRDSIEDELERLPQGKNIHFYYLPVSERIRKMCWNQGDWRFYYYYRKWQKRALALAKKIVSEQHIDIVHQLNMVGFREPGFLWKIDSVPFVWGPMAGMITYPMSYAPKISSLSGFKFWLKNVITHFQAYYAPRVVRAMRRADVLIAATENSMKIITDYYHKKATLIAETGLDLQAPRRTSKNGSFDIVWAGHFMLRKRLDLAIRSIACIREDCPAMKLHVYGSGNSKQEREYRALSESLGVADRVVWHGRTSREQVLEGMSSATLFMLTSVSEATSTVVLEAIGSGLPVLCFNTCGFGPLVKETGAGITVELSTPEDSVRRFAQVLLRLYNNPQELERYSQNCVDHSPNLSWDHKAEIVCKLYDEAIKAFSNK